MTNIYGTDRLITTIDEARDYIAAKGGVRIKSFDPIVASAIKDSKTAARSFINSNRDILSTLDNFDDLSSALDNARNLGDLNTLVWDFRTCVELAK